MLVYALYFFAAVWLLAIYKVFILDDGIEYADKVKALVKESPVVENHRKLDRNPIRSSKQKYSTHALTTIDQGSRVDNHPAPLSSEWIFLRSDQNSDALTKSILDGKPIITRPKHDELSSQAKKFEDHVNTMVAAPKKFASFGRPKISIGKSVVSNQAPKAGHLLKWPAVRPDGTIDPEDGTDIMPVTEMVVPKFWEPEPGADLNKIGSKVNGQETIFLMIASYRDFQCRETITLAFNRADHPERLFVGAVDQTVPGDTGCLDIDIPCSQDPNQAICKYRDQISVYHMDAQYATGPVTARHIGDRMYRGEYFVMQMDAHCQFVNHWDSKIINQWRSTHNEMAVLTSYLTDVQGSIDKNGDSTRNTRPIMCNSDFEGEMPARYLRHGSQPEAMPEIHDMPQLEPFWAAGFSFSRGHFTLRVPYDGYQPMVFQGEEIAIGIRGFTHGYDFYAPRDSVVFHEYAEMSSRRKKIHMFWENSQKHVGEAKKSLRRSMSIIEMAPDIDPSTWDHSEMDKYGLGKVRELSLFYKIFLIDAEARKATQLCPFVQSGVMHKDFQPYLRPDGLGIDYTQLLDYDTQDTLQKKKMGRLQPYWARKLENAMEHRQKEDLRAAIASAEKIVSMDQQGLRLLESARSLLGVL